MTIMDKRGEFCDAVALNLGGAAQYLIGDVYNLKSATIDPNTLRDIEGSDVYLVISVETTATSGGAATGQFHLASDAQAAIAVDGSATYHFSSAIIPVAQLIAGRRIACVRLPSGSYEQFLGILQQTATAAFTAGKIDAFLTNDPSIWRAYADNVS